MALDGGIGASAKRREDVRFLTGKGRYTDDLNRPGQAYVHFLRSDVAHGRHPVARHRGGRGDAGRAQGLHREGLRGRRRRALRLAGHRPLRPADEGAEAPGARRRQGAPRRRPGRRGRRRDAGRRRATPPRRSSSTSRSCRRSSTCARRSTPRRRWSTTTSAPTSASTGASSRTTAPRSTRRSRAAPHVTTLELVNNRLVPNAMEPRAAVGEYDAGRRPAHALDHQPEPARHPAADGRLRARHPRAQAAGGGAGRRRRLRLEDLPLRRGGVRHLRGEGGRAAGEVDLDAVGGVRLRRARPRPCHEDRAGARRGRQVPGAPHRHARQHGRLSLDLRALHPDLPARHADGRQLRDAADPRERAGGLHQHRAGRRLPRRRAAGGDLLDRAGHRQGGARARHRPGGDPAEELREARPVPLPDPGRGATTTPATTTRRWTCSSASPTAPASPARRAESAATRQAARLRRRLLHRGLRHRAVEPRRRARRARRPLRERDDPGERHRLDLGLHRQPQPRAGARDDLRPGGRRRCSASTPARSTSCTATPRGCPSAWAPTARARWRSAARRSSRRPRR